MPESRAGSLVLRAYEPLLLQIRAARSEIVLVSPFLSATVARELAAAADASHARRRFLFGVHPRSVGQHGRIRLTLEQFETARAAIVDV